MKNENNRVGGVLDVGMGKFSPSTAVHSIIIVKYLQFALRSVLIRKNKIKVTCELKGCYNSSFLMNKKKLPNSPFWELLTFKFV